MVEVLYMRGVFSVLSVPGQILGVLFVFLMLQQSMVIRRHSMLVAAGAIWSAITILTFIFTIYYQEFTANLKND